MEKSLQGEVAVVTGVSRFQGIGAAIGRELAASGAELFLTGWPAYDESLASNAECSGLDQLLDDLLTRLPVARLRLAFRAGPLLNPSWIRSAYLLFLSLIFHRDSLLPFSVL